MRQRSLAAAVVAVATVVALAAPAWAAPRPNPSGGAGSSNSQAGGSGASNGNGNASSAPGSSAASNGNSGTANGNSGTSNGNSGTSNGNSGTSNGNAGTSNGNASPGNSGSANGGGNANANAGGNAAGANAGSSGSKGTGNSAGNAASAGAGNANGAASQSAQSAASAANGRPQSVSSGRPGNAGAQARLVTPRGASAAERALARLATSEDKTDVEEAQDAAVADCLITDVASRQAKAAKGRQNAATRAPASTGLVAELLAACEESVGTRGSYLVKFTPGTPAQDAADKAAGRSALRPENRMKVKRVYSSVFPGMAVTASAKQIEALRKNPNVELVEPDGIAQSIAVQAPAPWGLDRIDQRGLPLSGDYAYTAEGAGVTAYVIDTGLRADHQDFSGRTRAGYSAIADGLGTGDCNGHGTHVAGTVGGTTYGVAKGVAIVPVRVLDCSGSGTWSGVLAGLDWVARDHAAGAPAVANMSLGGGANTMVDDAVRAVIADGVSVAVAAGNSATDACSASPARVAEAVTVAASDSSDGQASFSNVGSCVDIYAPGVGVVSDWYTSPTATASLSGTSMASPHVAGALALLAPTSPTAAWDALKSKATAGAIRNATAGTANLLLYAPDASTPPPPPPADPDPVATVPAAPAAPTGVAGSKSVTVSWQLPADGGSPLTGQTVWVLNSRGRVAGTIAVAGDATTVLVSGLAPRKEYRFAVSATNVVGTGPRSEWSSGVVTGR